MKLNITNGASRGAEMANENTGSQMLIYSDVSLFCTADTCSADVLPCTVSLGAHWYFLLFSGSQAWSIAFLELLPQRDKVLGPKSRAAD